MPPKNVSKTTPRCQDDDKTATRQRHGDVKDDVKGDATRGAPTRLFFQPFLTDARDIAIAVVVCIMRGRDRFRSAEGTPLKMLQIATFLSARRRATPIAIAIAVAAMIAAMSSSALAGEKFAATVVDATTGRILHAEHPDATRHPASLTKVMTLYMTFHELRDGRLSLNERVRMTAAGAAKEPSKLGLKEGETLSVDAAIRSLATKSANDVATALAEKIGGSEATFARRMTAAARRLGMTRTTFRNASGLHDPRQVTTARDMATLGLRIRRDFPEYYHYFSLRSFSYRGRTYANHNKLLSQYEGSDGIKTGYIRASGYNLMSSARRYGKHLVGVVMGGRTGASRNAYMKKILERAFAKAAVRIPGVIAKTAGRPPGWSASPNAEQFTASVPARRPEARTMEALIARSAADPDLNETGSASSHDELDGWKVQVGAYYDAERAQERLNHVRRIGGKLLKEKIAAATASRSSSTRRTLHRAQFGGFASRKDARNACRALEKQNVRCLALGP